MHMDIFCSRPYILQCMPNGPAWMICSSGFHGSNYYLINICISSPCPNTPWHPNWINIYICWLGGFLPVTDSWGQGILFIWYHGGLFYELFTPVSILSYPPVIHQTVLCASLLDGWLLCHDTCLEKSFKSSISTLHSRTWSPSNASEPRLSTLLTRPRTISGRRF
jgi:hypothetical protein